MNVIVDGIVYGLQKYGGINTYFNEVLPRLAERHVSTVHLLLPRTCEGATPRPPVQARRRDFIPFWTGLSLSLDEWLEPKVERVNRRLNGLWAGAKNRVVFQSTYFTSLPGSIPHVAIVHDMNHERFPEKYSTPFGTWLRRQYPKYLRRATRIIAVSQATKRDVVHYYGIDESLIDVVYHATNGHIFFVDRDEELLAYVRDTLKIRLPYLLYVGARNQAYKNFSALIQAFARCAQRTDLTLVVAGPPWRDDELSEINALGIQSDVRLIEYPETGLLRSLYNFATAFVFPSRNEGFGIPLLEAMACGTPVIASDIDVFREVAGEAAIYFDPADMDDLMRAIETALDDKVPDRFSSLGLECVNRYSWDRCASETYAVYQKALASR